MDEFDLMTDEIVAELNEQRRKDEKRAMYEPWGGIFNKKQKEAPVAFVQPRGKA